MLKHIVMMRFKSADKQIKTQQMNKLKEMLYSLLDSIAVLDYLEVGFNLSKRSSAFDLVLLTHFKSEKELDLYRTHPEHLKVLEFISEVISETAVVDYYIGD